MRLLKPARLFGAILLLLALPGRAQEFSYRHYSVPQGLAQTQVQCLFQDSQGYLWIGTKGGLSRFDGREFRNFTKQDGLPSNLVNKIIEDSLGNIWGKTRGNLFTIDPSGKVRALKMEVPGYHPIFFYIDENKVLNVVYFANDFSWRIYSQAGDTFGLTRQFALFEEQEKPDIQYSERLYAYHKGEQALYVNNSPGGLFKIKDGKVRQIASRDRGLRIMKLCADGNIYLVNADTLFMLHHDQLSPVFVSASLFSAGADCLEADVFGNIYYQDSTYSLHWIYKGQHFTDNKVFECYSHLFVDKENHLWLGSDAVGLYQLTGPAFVNFIPGKCGMPTYVFGVVEDASGNLWIGSQSKGLSRYDGQTFTEITSYQHLLPDATFYPGNLLTHGGDLLLAHRGGLLKYDKGKFERLLPSWVNAIARLDPGRLLLGGIKGLAIFDLKLFDSTAEEKFKVYNQDNGFEGIEVNQLGIVKDGKGFFWIICSDRVVRLDPTASTVSTPTGLKPPRRVVPPTPTSRPDTTPCA